jgi:hypothetical protein
LRRPNAKSKNPTAAAAILSAEIGSIFLNQSKFGRAHGDGMLHKAVRIAVRTKRVWGFRLIRRLGNVDHH